MEIYLDNSATTACNEEVAKLMMSIFTEDYGNPSSMHNAGIKAEKHIKKAKEQLAAILKAEPKEIFFTSGGTEGDNLAITGAAMAHKRRGMHIITTSVEHPAVHNTMRYLEKQGFEVTYLPVREDGRIDVKDFEAALRDDTILVSIMHTNNETGAIMPIKEVAEIIKRKALQTPGNKADTKGGSAGTIVNTPLFHVDAVQGFGRNRIYPGRMGIDLLTISSHKIHGPKGCGVLYKNKNARIVPLLYGGGQQEDLRPGTENVPGIAGTGLAAELMYKDMDGDNKRLYELSGILKEGILKLENTFINSPCKEKRSPHILNASFVGIRSEVLLHALEDKGIYVSAGSACASNKRESFSDTLKAMGLSKERMDSAIRFSFSALNTQDEVDETLRALGELVPVLRRYSR